MVAGVAYGAQEKVIPNLIIYVSYAQIRHHQLELLYEIYTSCVLC